MARSDVVSNSSEELILVDELDREIGQSAKSDCHSGNGTLHRAFSIFLFNERDELLLQRRSAEKPLWPDYWSNTCCSHPRVGETMEQALSRRLIEELGIECPLHFLYKFKYHAQYGAVGAEQFSRTSFESCRVWRVIARSTFSASATFGLGSTHPVFGWLCQFDASPSGCYPFCVVRTRVS